MPRKKLKDMEVVKRFKAESPDFFKKVQWLGGILTTLGGVLIATPIGVPLATAGGVMVIIGKLPVKGLSVEDAEKLKSELETLKSKKN